MACPRFLCALLFLGPLYVSAFVGSPSLARHSRGLPLRSRSSASPRGDCSMMAKPVQLPSGDSFELFEKEVLQSQAPVLVDFHAAWCAPCLMLAPVMDKMAVDFDGKLQIVKVDCDSHKDLMKHYRARGLPLLVIFSDGKAVARHEGHLDYEDVVKFVEDKVPEFNA